jgi:flagellar hook-basal body complex protein FliE
MAAKKVLDSFGMKAVRKPDVLARQLADAVNRHGKQAMYRIAAVHPDLELITQFNEYNAQKENKSDSCGCKDKDTSLFSSAEGQVIKSAVEDIKRNQEASNQVNSNAKEGRSEKSELMIIGAIALVGLALVLKK